MPLRADFLDNDLTLVFMVARIGLGHGWSHLYSLALQQQAFAELRPGAPWHSGRWFPGPPPYVWLVTPMVTLGPRAAVAIGIALTLAALVGGWWIAAPGDGWRRGLWLLGALAWYPVLYALSLVQPDFMVLFLVALAWKLSDGHRPYLGGAVLGLTAGIKPQLALLLPLVLVTSGRWRIALTWAAVAGTLALVSLVSLGPDGFGEYRSLLSMVQQIPNNRYFTAAYVLGPGPAAYVFSGLVIALAAVAGYLNRGSDGARVFALGLAATAVGATYWHLQDFTMLVLVAWLFWRDAPPAWQRAWLLVPVIGAEFAWALTPLPVLVGVVVWLAFLVPGPKGKPVPA